MVEAELTRLERDYGSLRTAFERLLADHEAVRSQRDAVTVELTLLQGSITWRASRPIRELAQWMRSRANGPKESRSERNVSEIHADNENPVPQARPVFIGLEQEPCEAPGANAASGERTTYDTFIDLTSCDLDDASQDDYLSRLAHKSARGNGGGILIAVSAEVHSAPADAAMDSPQAPRQLLMQAISRAAARRHHLLVLLAPLIPQVEVVSQLIDVLDRDPMFGTAQPRFAQADGGVVWPLPSNKYREWAGPKTSPSVLPLLPPYTITPELLSACLLLRWDALVALEGREVPYASVTGALSHLTCQMRRIGMRNAVVNHALLRSTLPYAKLYPLPPSSELSRLRTQYPDNSLAEVQVAGLAERRLEALLSTAGSERPRRILLDCRAMIPVHNGTAACVLGLLDGFSKLACTRDIDILLPSESAAFHGITQRYPTFRAVCDEPVGEYFAAVCLSHPWSFEALADLHSHSLVLVFTMLDTISWDILYTPGANTVGSVWQFVARHADGLLYISDFTRQRFRNRFPVSADVSEQVIPLSLSQQDHVHPQARSVPVSDYILVFGNAFDHKAVHHTVEQLVDAFPFRRIIALGTQEPVGANVESIASGHLDDFALHRLIAAARVIVYPSFYEGFGLPVVEGLAYGRPVVVRHSALWSEIAGSSRLPGALIEFDDTASLIQVIGNILSGRSVRPLATGTQLINGSCPPNWEESARRVIALLNECGAKADGSRWIEREETLRIGRPQS